MPPSNEPDEPPDEPPTQTDLDDVEHQINVINGPAIMLLSSLSALGVVIGGGLFALGQQVGVRVMTMSASTGGALMLGGGVIDILASR